jgi:peptidoglycan/xylan/chitin deacetylase (PgdA/CDA1 family)
MGRVLGSVALIVIVAVCPLPAAAQDKSLLERCWTPQTLADAPAELKARRAHGKLDLAALRQQPLTDLTPVPEAERGSIRSVELPPGEKLIALTFDLCETDGMVAGYDGRIVDVLRAEGAKATFFASGKWMETHEERTAQLLADANFEIGAHGFRHLDMRRLSAEALRDEIVLTEAAYDRARKNLAARQCATPNQNEAPPAEHLSLIRFPYGTCNKAALTAAAEAGQLAIQWDLITGDPDPRRSAKAIAETILSQVHPGAIVVAHANGRGRHTAAALALAIPKLKEQGYRFATVSELLKAGKPVIVSSCYLTRPGSTMRMARSHSHRRKSSDGVRLFGPAN